MREKTNRAPRLTARVELKDGAMRGAMHIYDAVGGWDGIRAKDVVEKLEALKAEGAQHLDVHVNSPGGSVFEGMAIHTAIAAWDKGSKIVHIDGLAASIASVIAMAGDEIHIAPAAMVMVHEPSDWTAGTADDMRKCADKLDAIRGVMCGVYAKRTGQTLSEIEKMVSEETWLSAEQAVAKGFADKVVEPDEEPDQDDPEEGEEEDRAVALFRRPPPHIKQLLHLSLPAAHAAGAPQESAVTFEELKTKLTEATTAAAAMQARAETAEKTAAEVKASQDEWLAATGKQSVPEAAAHVKGLQQAADQVPVLAAQVKKLEDEKISTERDQIIAKAKAEGRMVPAQDEWAKAQTLPALKAFLAVAPKIVPIGQVHLEPATAGGRDLTDGGKKSKWADFTPAEKARLHDEMPEFYAGILAEHQKSKK